MTAEQYLFLNSVCLTLATGTLATVTLATGTQLREKLVYSTQPKVRYAVSTKRLTYLGAI